MLAPKRNETVEVNVCRSCEETGAGVCELFRYLWSSGERGASRNNSSLSSRKIIKNKLLGGKRVSSHVSSTSSLAFDDTRRGDTVLIDRTLDFY